MNKRMVWMLIGVGILFGGIFGFKAFVNAMITEVFDNMPAPTVTVTAAEAQEMRWTRELDAVGSFAAVQGAMLTTELGGIVREIRFENGTRVETGSELVVLDTASEQAHLRSLEAARRLAELELQRARRLYAEKNISEAELQRRQSEADQATAAVNEQRALIRQKTLRAPFSGELGIRRVNVGQYVAAGDPLVSLQSVDPIFLNFSVPERRAAEIRLGQKVRARVDARNAEFEGTISAIEPSVDAATRTIDIQAQVPNPEGTLRPGMFARVSLALGEPQTVLVVPQGAISFSPYGNSVYVITEEPDQVLRVQRRFVQTGARRGDFVRVQTGLEPGTRVATSGLLKLRNGSTVNVSDDEAVQPRQDLVPEPDNA